MVSCHSLWID